MAIRGAHALLYTSEPEKLREMLGDVFGLDHVDAGGGWLIFALPPAEVGVHPLEAGERPFHALSFMCDDIAATVAELKAKGVTVKGEPVDQGYGIFVDLELPGEVPVQLYEPRHPVAAKGY